jgi:predicted mannosyl-3-phosphoglycerate phosphatase (HAD superfamily)
VVNTGKAQAARRRAALARRERALARHLAENPAEQARRAEVANRLRQVRRALAVRRAAAEAIADAERRIALATARLVELGLPVAEVARRVGVPAAALRKTLRAHLLSRAAASEEA